MYKALKKLIQRLESLPKNEQEENIEKIFTSFLILKKMGLSEKESILKSINTPTNESNKKFIALNRIEAIQRKRKTTIVFRRLYRYKDKILELNELGYSYAKIIHYLYLNHRLKKCSRMTMHNFIKEIKNLQ